MCSTIGSEQFETNSCDRSSDLLKHCQRDLHCTHWTWEAFCSGASDLHRSAWVFCGGTPTGPALTPKCSTFCGGVILNYWDNNCIDQDSFSLQGVISQSESSALTIATQCRHCVITGNFALANLATTIITTFCGGVFRHWTPNQLKFCAQFFNIIGVGSLFSIFSLALILTAGFLAVIQQYCSIFYFHSTVIFNFCAHLLAFALVQLFYFGSDKFPTIFKSGSHSEDCTFQHRYRSSEWPQLSLPRFGSRSGPKSGRAGIRSFYRVILVLLLSGWMTQFHLHGGEGDGPPTGTIETLQQWESTLINKSSVKPCGPQPATSSGFHWLPKDNAIVKRSVKRAYHRALNDGISWYRGKCYQPQDFPVFQLREVQPQPKPRPSKHSSVSDKQICNGHHQDKKYLRCFHWTAGRCPYNDLMNFVCGSEAKTFRSSY